MNILRPVALHLLDVIKNEVVPVVGISQVAERHGIFGAEGLVLKLASEGYVRQCCNGDETLVWELTVSGEERVGVLAMK